MRSNYDTYRQRRLEVLQDLQKYSRRAKGIAPVANYEDLGIIRNTIRPALELDKFAAVVEFVPDPADLTLILDLGGIDKYAGWLADIGSGISNAAGRAWEGVKTLGRDVIYPTFRLPYDIGKSIGSHVSQAWRPGSGFLGNLGRSAIGTLSGIMEPVEDIAGGAYRGIRDVTTGTAGMIPGVELGFQKMLSTPYLGTGLRVADIAGESLARLAPSLAPMLIPGGQGVGAAGIAANLGRFGRLLSAARTPLMYAGGGEALLRQWPHTGGGIGEGLRATLMGEQPGHAQTVAQVPQGQIQSQDDYLRQLGTAASGLFNPSVAMGTMLPGVSSDQIQGLGGLMGQMSQAFGSMLPQGSMGSLIGQLPQGMLMPAGTPA